MRVLVIILSLLFYFAANAQSNIEVITINDSLFVQERVESGNPRTITTTQTYVGDSTTFAQNLLNSYANLYIELAASKQRLLRENQINRTGNQLKGLFARFGKEPLARVIARNLVSPLLEGNTRLEVGQRVTDLYFRQTNTGNLRVSTDSTGNNNTVISELVVFNNTVGILKLTVNTSTTNTPNVQEVEFVLYDVNTNSAGATVRREWRVIGLPDVKLIQRIPQRNANQQSR